MEMLGWFYNLACFIAYTTFFTIVALYLLPNTSIRYTQLTMLKVIVSDFVSDSVKSDPNNIEVWRFIQTNIRNISTTSADLSISHMFTELERLSIYSKGLKDIKVKWSSLRLQRSLWENLKKEVTLKPELARLFIPKNTLIQWIEYGLRK